MEKKIKNSQPQAKFTGSYKKKGWDNFCASQKVYEKWKENFRMSQESFEIMY